MIERFNSITDRIVSEMHLPHGVQQNACVTMCIITDRFHEAREHEVKMWELESLRSDSDGHVAVSATNPVLETSFGAIENK